MAVENYKMLSSAKRCVFQYAKNNIYGNMRVCV